MRELLLQGDEQGTPEEEKPAGEESSEEQS